MGHSERRSKLFNGQNLEVYEKQKINHKQKSDEEMNTRKLKEREK